MRIVELCSSKSLGGLELYFTTCCKKLKERNHEVLAVVSNNSKAHRLIRDNVKCLSTKHNLIGTLLLLHKKLKKWQPDVLHTHHKRDLLLVALLKRFSSVPFIYIHTRQMDMPRTKKNPYHTFLYQSIDLIIAISDNLKKQIIEHVKVNPKKVKRLYYGVTKKTLTPERCRELKINRNAFNIGVIARIDRKKDQHILIEAMQILHQQGIDHIEAYLIGDSTDDNYLSEIKNLIKGYGLNQKTYLKGFVENPQEIMSCFNVIVLTTSNETFGLVLPEAMRQGTAVIGANGGGVPEIIENQKTGLLFNPHDPHDLSEKIKLMMNKTIRERLSANGKRKADETFEIEHHFASLEKLMEDKMNSNNKQSIWNNPL